MAAAPPPVPTPVLLDTALAGHWAGTLGYRDYQTNALVKLKIKTAVRAVADGVTTIRASEFDEGSGRTPAFITNIALYDAAAATVSSVSARKGQPIEVSTDQLRVAEFTDATHWTIVAERDGSDNDKPAKLRTTERRNGDRLTATEDVMPAGTTAWAFRNVTELTRKGD